MNLGEFPAVRRNSADPDLGRVETSSLADLMAAALQRSPERTLIEYQDRAYSARWIQHQADTLAEALRQAGLGPKEPVGLVPRNNHFGVAGVVGLVIQARDIYMVHPFQAPEAMAEAIMRLRVRAIVAVAEDFSGAVRAAVAGKGVAGVALTESGAQLVEGLERASGEAIRHRDEPHFHVLTSGTTGSPKHIPLPQRLFAPDEMLAGMQFSKPVNAASEEIPSLLYIPFGNIGGLLKLVPTFAGGGSAKVLDKFNPHAWRDYIVQHRPPRAALTPAGFRMILDADIPREDLANLRSIATGSAPVDPGVQRQFEARYGIPILIGYGATEFAGSATQMTPELHSAWGERKVGSAGRALPGVTVRTVNMETGEPISPGAEGLIEVLIPRVSSEWIRTSDIGVLDEDDFLFLRGRADGAIVRGGFKILPETIEVALQAHPKVSAAAVVGVPDPRLGQTPAAAVEPAPGIEPPTVEELMKHLRSLLLAPQIPTEIRIVESLPRTGSMKIARGQVKAMFDEI